MSNDELFARLARKIDISLFMLMVGMGLFTCLLSFALHQ